MWMFFVRILFWQFFCKFKITSKSKVKKIKIGPWIATHHFHQNKITIVKVLELKVCFCVYFIDAFLNGLPTFIFLSNGNEDASKIIEVKKKLLWLVCE